MSDLRFAFRQLIKSPVFTAVAVVSLALGIGANTAIFSLVNGVLLRSLPVPNPHELRVLKWRGTDAKLGNFHGALYDDGPRVSLGDSFTYPMYSTLRKDLGEVAELFGYHRLIDVAVRAQREAVGAEGMLVSDNFFSALGVPTRIGRLLTAKDDRDGAPPATVISHALWEQQFRLDPEVLGQPLLLNGHSFTVVGVLPREFRGIRPSDGTAFYVPMVAQPQLEPFWKRTADNLWWVQMMARLDPTTSDAQFQAAADVAFGRLADAVMQDPKVVVEAGHAGPAYDRSYHGKPLLLLLGVVGVVILVACANLAGLSLARGAAREHEYAVRAAIGAGRWRLVRQSLSESLILALCGAGLGIVLALWAKTAIARLLVGSPDGLRYDTALDTTVLSFTLFTALITAVLAGLLPAVRAGGINPVAGLQARGTQGSPRLRMGRVLVAAQVALSLVLLTGAGLYGRSLINLVRVDPGFAKENLLLFYLNAESTDYNRDRRATLYAEIQNSLTRIPDVQSAAVCQNALLSGWMSGGSFFTLPGRPTSGQNRPRAHRLTVSESFFDTMRIPLLLGRGFRTTDQEGTPKVVIVNETFAREYLSGESAIGQALRTGRRDGNPVDWQIVGVVADAKYTNIKTEVPPTVYFSFRQDDIDSTYFAVRLAAAPGGGGTALPPLSIVPAVRQAVAAIDPDMPVLNVSTQQDLLDENITQERLFATLCGALAGLALLLCCIGLYGLMAYNVARRTGEIGIRMAIGAQPQDVARPILREALVLGALGVAIGVPIAFALSRIIESQLYNVTPNDPIAYVAGALLLIAVAALAAWVPARRAARVDPVEALRAE